MPPYQNESLHDMHALMQQLDDLNAAHALDHLGARKKNETESAQKQPKPAAKPPKPPQKTVANTAKPVQKQPEPDTEDQESGLATEQPKNNVGLLARAGSVTKGFSEMLHGKALTAAQIQQSFCQIAALSEHWSPDVVKDMEKMLKSNKSTKAYCPATQPYTVPELVKK